MREISSVNLPLAIEYPNVFIKSFTVIYFLPLSTSSAMLTAFGKESEGSIRVNEVAIILRSNGGVFLSISIFFIRSSALSLYLYIISLIYVKYESA